MSQPCPTCKDWGNTINADDYPPGTYLVYCHACGRATYPNLGVNLPAGAAWCLGTSRAVSLLSARPGPTPFALAAYGRMRRAALRKP